MAWLSDFDIRQIDDTYFQLLQDLVYYSEKYGLKITVPAGMVSDGPSVPRAPLLYWLFGHKGKRAAVIHDWLYRCALLPRDVCDSIFREALMDSGKLWVTSAGMYLGVRVGGWPSYSPEKKGCLDTRRMCDRDCLRCDNFIGSFALTVVPFRRGL